MTIALETKKLVLIRIWKVGRNGYSDSLNIKFLAKTSNFSVKDWSTGAIKKNLIVKKPTAMTQLVFFIIYLSAFEWISLRVFSLAYH